MAGLNYYAGVQLKAKKELVGRRPPTGGGMYISPISPIVYVRISQFCPYHAKFSLFPPFRTLDFKYLPVSQAMKRITHPRYQVIFGTVKAFGFRKSVENLVFLPLGCEKERARSLRLGGSNHTSFKLVFNLLTNFFSFFRTSSHLWQTH